ncbi:MAG: hypothetical protein IJC33_03575 [Clostridia bacterium]|nr:hypothetical protein [Clostridia bacterium]
MKLFFKKLIMVPLYAFVIFCGLFGAGLVVKPFNFPYLLKLPQESEYVIAAAFSLLFTVVVAVIVRTDSCRKHDLLLPDGKSLILRVLRFREFHMELLVFALLSMVFQICVGASTEAPLWWLALGALLLTAGSTLVFAIVDGLIWMISVKRAYR